MTKKLEKILLAEDEEDIRTIAQIALEDIGQLQAEFCASGQEVLNKVDSFRPDLIILDVMMPGMDGVATFHALQKKPEFAKIPVIFMTAKVQSTEILSYKEMGALEVIAKPFDPMTLADQIQSIWKSQ